MDLSDSVGDWGLDIEVSDPTSIDMNEGARVSNLALIDLSDGQGLGPSLDGLGTQV